MHRHQHLVGGYVYDGWMTGHDGCVQHLLHGVQLHVGTVHGVAFGMAHCEMQVVHMHDVDGLA